MVMLLNVLTSNCTWITYAILTHLHITTVTLFSTSSTLRSYLHVTKYKLMLQQIARSTVQNPVNSIFGLQWHTSLPCEVSFSLTYYILWVQIIERVSDPAVSPWGFRGQRGSGEAPSPWGSDRLTCLAAMIDTLGLVWPFWLTSTSSLLAPVIISGLKCRFGNSGAAPVYSVPFLLDF